MASPANCRPLVIVHNLGCGCGHTTRHYTAGTAIGRVKCGTVVIIGLALIPSGSQERRNGIGLRSGPVGNSIGIGLHVCNLPVHLVEPVLHGLGQDSCREITLVTIAQHLRQAVVTGHHNKTAVLTAVKNVEPVIVGSIGEPNGRLSRRCCQSR